MKRILISPKIIKDDYGQSGQFLDTAWIKYFKNKADLFTPIQNQLFQKIILYLMD